MSISENAMNGLNRRNFLVGAGAAATVSTFSITGRARAATAGKVVFYSTMPTRYADDMVKAFQASDVGKESGVELEFYFANGYVLYERAVAEYTAGRVSHDLIMPLVQWAHDPDDLWLQHAAGARWREQDQVGGIPGSAL
jgi:hypothetical protein